MSYDTLYSMDSKLQILSGAHRGRKLYLPQDARPTQAAARVAIFNMLGAGMFDLPDNLVVWDAFGGSGVLGLEMLSRYPNARVIFTDSAATSIKTIRRNVELIGAQNATQVEMADALGAAKRYGAMADIIFVDPPYADGEIGARLVQKLGVIAKDGAIVVWEQDTSTQLFDVAAPWRVVRDKRYGRARFLILQKESAEKP